MIGIGWGLAVIMWALGAAIINDIHKEFEEMTGEELDTPFKLFTLALWPVIQLYGMIRGNK